MEDQRKSKNSGKHAEEAQTEENQQSDLAQSIRIDCNYRLDQSELSVI